MIMIRSWSTRGSRVFQLNCQTNPYVYHCLSCFHLRFKWCQCFYWGSGPVFLQVSSGPPMSTICWAPPGKDLELCALGSCGSKVAPGHSPKKNTAGSTDWQYGWMFLTSNTIKYLGSRDFGWFWHCSIPKHPIFAIAIPTCAAVRLDHRRFPESGVPPNHQF